MSKVIDEHAKQQVRDRQTDRQKNGKETFRDDAEIRKDAHMREEEIQVTGWKRAEREGKERGVGSW